MVRPLVSTIIPAYNAATTIGSTLASLRAQTFTNWEAIVIDDGSTDNTADTVNAIDDPRIRVIRYPNAGQAEGRNRGIQWAKGDFIAFLDADDWWTPEKLDDQVKALQRHRAAAVAYSWTDYVNGENQLLHPGFHSGPSGHVYEELLRNNFIENGSNPLVQRSAIEAIGGFDSSLIPAEDWDYWLRLAHKFPFVAIPKVQVRYRVSATSSSASLDRLEQACTMVLDRHLRNGPLALSQLHRPAKSRFYKGLACKAFTTGTPDRKRAVRSGRLLALAIAHQPNLLWKEPRFITIMIAKTVAIALFGPGIWKRCHRYRKR